MKYISLIFSAMLLFVSLSLAETKLDDINKTFKNISNGALKVSLNNGDIFISTWNKNDVEIKVKGSYRNDQNDNVITKNGNNISIKLTHGWGGNIGVEVKVPRSFKLDLRTLNGDISIENDLKGDVSAVTNGGDISIGNVDGEIDVKTFGGEIFIGNISKDAVINTMGGDIIVESIKGQASIQTMGGDIRGKDVSQMLTAKTFGGDISFNKLSDKSNISTQGGDITIEEFSDELDISTQGGDLKISRGKGKIKASTHGGDISFIHIEGSVIAKTFSGDIKIGLIPQLNTNTKLESMNGDIELSIPTNAKVKIIAKVKTHGFGNRDDNKIVSELGTVIEQERNTSYFEKTFIINNGGAEINLETISSDIEIKKMSK